MVEIEIGVLAAQCLDYATVLHGASIGMMGW
jgi:hypothetical protein